MRWILLFAILGGCSSGTKHDDGPASTPQPPPPPTREAAPTPPTTMPKVHLTTPQGDLVVNVEIVSTSAQLERGMMFREHLPPDNGMLFLMKNQQVWSFWMRNTLIPLDMIFIAEDMTIAGIVENAEPRTEILRHVTKPSRYVLEVNGGYSAAHKVVAGNTVRFENVPPR